MAKVKLGNVKGSKGDKGDRGSLWRVTDKMTGQSTSDTAFPGANIEDSAVGDMCLNPITCDIYKCTAGGDAANAKWVWVMNNRGPQGPAGPKGDPTTVDAVLSKVSVNPIQNKAVATKFQDVQDSLGRAVDTSGTTSSASVFSQGSIRGGDYYGGLFLDEDESASIRIVFSQDINKLIVMKTLDGKDVELRTI